MVAFQESFSRVIIVVGYKWISKLSSFLPSPPVGMSVRDGIAGTADA